MNITAEYISQDELAQKQDSPSLNSRRLTTKQTLANKENFLILQNFQKSQVTNPDLIIQKGQELLQKGQYDKVLLLYIRSLFNKDLEFITAIKALRRVIHSCLKQMERYIYKGLSKKAQNKFLSMLNLVILNLQNFNKILYKYIFHEIQFYTNYIPVEENEDQLQDELFNTQNSPKQQKNNQNSAQKQQLLEGKLGFPIYLFSDCQIPPHKQKLYYFYLQEYFCNLINALLCAYQFYRLIDQKCTALVFIQKAHQLVLKIEADQQAIVTSACLNRLCGKVYQILGSLSLEIDSYNEANDFFEKSYNFLQASIEDFLTLFMLQKIHKITIKQEKQCETSVKEIVILLINWSILSSLTHNYSKMIECMNLIQFFSQKLLIYTESKLVQQFAEHIILQLKKKYFQQIFEMQDIHKIVKIAIKHDLSPLSEQKFSSVVQHKQQEENIQNQYWDKKMYDKFNYQTLNNKQAIIHKDHTALHKQSYREDLNKNNQLNLSSSNIQNIGNSQLIQKKHQSLHVNASQNNLDDHTRDQTNLLDNNKSKLSLGSPKNNSYLSFQIKLNYSSRDRPLSESNLKQPESDIQIKTVRPQTAKNSNISQFSNKNNDSKSKTANEEKKKKLLQKTQDKQFKYLNNKKYKSQSVSSLARLTKDNQEEEREYNFQKERFKDLILPQPKQVQEFKEGVEELDHAMNQIIVKKLNENQSTQDYYSRLNEFFSQMDEEQFDKKEFDFGQKQVQFKRFKGDGKNVLKVNPKEERYIYIQEKNNINQLFSKYNHEAKQTESYNHLLYKKTQKKSSLKKNKIISLPGANEQPQLMQISQLQETHNKLKFQDVRGAVISKFNLAKVKDFVQEQEYKQLNQKIIDSENNKLLFNIQSVNSDHIDIHQDEQLEEDSQKYQMFRKNSYIKSQEIMKKIINLHEEEKNNIMKEIQEKLKRTSYFNDKGKQNKDVLKNKNKDLHIETSTNLRGEIKELAKTCKGLNFIKKIENGIGGVVDIVQLQKEVTQNYEKRVSQESHHDKKIPLRWQNKNYDQIQKTKKIE